MSNGPYDEEASKNFELGNYYGRYGALSLVLDFFKNENAKELVEKEFKKWEWLWCESNKRGYPISIEEWKNLSTLQNKQN